MLRAKVAPLLSSGGSGERAKRVGGGSATAAAILAFALTTGVSAESLAQPRDNALERTAADYVRFREDVAAIEAQPFTNAEVMREAHRRFAAHNSKALSSGWVAYAALVAADTPEFREALEEEVSSKKKKGKNKLSGADALFSDLNADPASIRSIKGADKAASRVLAMTAQDAKRIVDLGEAFKSQAYALQKTGWGKAKVPPAAQRLSEADRFAKSRPAATPPTMASVTENGVTAPGLSGADQLWKPEWGKGGGSGRMNDADAEALMNRVLGLAARYAVSGVNAKGVEVYARNDRADQCLYFASLTLKQCIAATRAPYEESFCLGEHALNDVAQCVGWIAGVDKS